jgi:antitoxin MazE
MEKDKDQIATQIAAKSGLDTTDDLARERALEKLRKLCCPFPPGFKFDRDEANAR